MPVSGDPLGQITGVDTGNRRLARRVDVHHDQRVGLVERREELSPQVVRTAVAVRLEDDPEALGLPQVLHRAEGGLDLGGVVAVVVEQGHAAGLADGLEAAAHAAPTADVQCAPRRSWIAQSSATSTIW